MCRGAKVGGVDIDDGYCLSSSVLCRAATEAMRCEDNMMSKHPIT